MSPLASSLLNLLGDCGARLRLLCSFLDHDCFVEFLGKVLVGVGFIFVPFSSGILLLRSCNHELVLLPFVNDTVFFLSLNLVWFPIKIDSFGIYLVVALCAGLWLCSFFCILDSRCLAISVM